MKFDFMSKSLSSLADIQTGPFGSQLHKEDYVDIGTPIVTVEHLGRKRFSEQNLPCVSAQDKERLSKYILQEGDIVFSRVGSVDRCSYVSKEYAGWMFSGRCLRVRPNADIDSQFLYYYFTLETTKQFVRGIATGATMPSINTKFMGEVPVVYPSIEIQRKIAVILSAIDNKIDVNNVINENLPRGKRRGFSPRRNRKPRKSGLHTTGSGKRNGGRNEKPQSRRSRPGRNP
ncbi:restriction endonuclease subunit S [Acutalibacter intestini]|uniref:restriction endonuclease subunit S n=1 Tax=Acutalibacter intestini TaxID=3093659 RepID=UPI002AC98C55|nr:restriction endonuclease subunit S [Acutalibacter sp. M00204]